MKLDARECVELQSWIELGAVTVVYSFRRSTTDAFCTRLC